VFTFEMPHYKGVSKCKKLLLLLFNEDKKKNESLAFQKKKHPFFV
jgi:hypothetical protein